MARMIDADALLVKQTNIAKTFARSDAQKSLMGRVMYNTEHAPTIDAIPVEYLMKYAQLPTEFAIAAWRKPDKDAQEKRIKRLDKPMSLDDALNLVNDVFPLDW